MRALTAWLRATLEYNPAFPISALLLMGGIRSLLAPVAGGHDVGTVAAVAGVVVGYETVLVGLALLVLWPRRIAYETTSLLTIEGVIRFAPAVAVLLLDPRQNLAVMLLLGGGTAGALVLRAELVARRVGLAARPWERLHASGLAVLATLGFPVLARELLTAGAAARPLGALAAAGVVAALAPGFLFLGRGPLGEGERPLASRLPVVVARLLDAVAVTLLFLLALWLNDVRLDPGALAPFALLAALAVAASSDAILGAHLGAGRVALLVPGAVAAGLVLAPHDVLAPFTRPGILVGISLPLALGLARFFRARWPSLSEGWVGERLALVAAAAAPFRFLGPREASGYVVALATIGAGVALARRLERTFLAAVAAVATVAVVALSRSETGEGALGALLLVLPCAGATLAGAAALRLGATGLAARAGAATVLAGAALLLAERGAPAFDATGLSAGAGLVALVGLTLRGRTRLHALATLAHLGLLSAAPVAGALRAVPEGVLLVLLAFLGLPLGCAIALRRERLLGLLDGTT